MYVYYVNKLWQLKILNFLLLAINFLTISELEAKVRAKGILAVSFGSFHAPVLCRPPFLIVAMEIFYWCFKFSIGYHHREKKNWQLLDGCMHISNTHVYFLNCNTRAYHYRCHLICCWAFRSPKKCLLFHNIDSPNWAKHVPGWISPPLIKF